MINPYEPPSVHIPRRRSGWLWLYWVVASCAMLFAFVFTCAGGTIAAVSIVNFFAVPPRDGYDAVGRIGANLFGVGLPAGLVAAALLGWWFWRRAQGRSDR